MAHGEEAGILPFCSLFFSNAYPPGLPRAGLALRWFPPLWLASMGSGALRYHLGRLHLPPPGETCLSAHRRAQDSPPTR